MKTKLRMRLEIKEISAEGTFEGILSPYNNVDGGKDVVKAGAYTKTLKDQGATRPLLWQHKSDAPIGQLTLEDRADGLWCKGQLLLEDDTAQKAYLFIKAGIVKGLSIGFEAVKDSVEAGIRYLSEIKLYEGSIVTFPMNEAALITSVKKAKESKGDFNEEFAEIQIANAAYDMLSAFSSARSAIVWSDLARDEKITAFEVVVQQFADAATSWFPNYLDYLTEQYGSMELWNKAKIEHKRRDVLFELKAGATFSKSNKAQIQSAIDILTTLIADEAAEDDATAKAAGNPGTSPTPAVETKSEPAKDHSAISSLLNSFKEGLQWSPSNNN
jgi:HK97 family phage prohead protease